MNKLTAMVTSVALATASIPAMSADPSPPSGSAGVSRAQPSKGAQEGKQTGIRQDFAELEKTVKEKVRDINRQMRQQLEQARKELKAKTAQIRQEAQEKIAALKREMQAKQAAAPVEERSKDK